MEEGLLNLFLSRVEWIEIVETNVLLMSRKTSYQSELSSLGGFCEETGRPLVGCIIVGIPFRCALD